MNGMRLKGKSTLITGAASGFGKEIAIRFAKEGSNLILTDLNKDGLHQTRQEIESSGSRVSIDLYRNDVSDFEDVQNLIHTVFNSGSVINILVNNAGWSHSNQPLLDVDYEAFRKVFEINVFSIYNFTQAMVPHWRNMGGGTMINISSTAGFRPRPGLTWYNSTKGAVNTMTKSLAVELAPDNIRVCGIAPVIGKTGLTEAFMGGPETPEIRKKFLDSIPLGRFSTPSDIASAALFLSSDEADFITGSILEVDGGRCI